MTDSFLSPLATPPADDQVLGLARAIYAARRRRPRSLPRAVLGEPAWDILLDLLVSAAEDRKVSVQSACLAADVPMTTATRCIASMVRLGLVTKRRDPVDARRWFVELTPGGRSATVAAVATATTFLMRCPCT